jgi:antitoxin CcdA
MTLNENLVRAAPEYTDNLSDHVEKLLASAIVEERRKKAEDERHWKEVCASWNEFHEKDGNYRWLMSGFGVMSLADCRRRRELRFRV